MRSKNHRFKAITILPAVILASLLLAPGALAQKYSITNLGILGNSGYGGYSEAYSINAAGQVVGDASTADGNHHAFLWQSGVMKDLGTLSGGSSLALGINNFGQVVGWSQPPGSTFGAGSTVFLAFIWQNSVMSPLGTLGGTNSVASAINNSGLVVGNSYIPGGTINGGYRAFVWTNGVMSKIVDAPWGSGAAAVNNAGQVVGVYTPIGSNRAFVWQNDVSKDLGDLGGGSSVAEGINDLGQIVGGSTVVNGDNHAFLWLKGVMTDLGVLGTAYAINNVDQIVGSASINGSAYGAFLWQNGVATDLNKLIPAGTGLQLADAKGINDAGQIVGTAISGSTRYAVLLTPNPFANPQAVWVAHNTATAIKLTGTDTETPRPPLTFAIKTKPTHGALGKLNTATGAVYYEPDNKFQGTDAFTFTVSNGVDTSAPATVTLHVAPGVPTANAQTVSVPHNTAKSFTLKGTDPDNPALPLTFVVKTEPAHGKVSGLNAATGAVTYTPGANKYGPDSFTFTVSNGTYTSAPATVTLNVAPGVPTAKAQTVNVTENMPVTITLTGSDPDNPALPLTFAIGTPPAHGKLSALNTTTCNVTYTPNANYHGVDSFTYTVSNGTNTSARATVTLKVSGGG